MSKFGKIRLKCIGQNKILHPSIPIKHVEFIYDKFYDITYELYSEDPVKDIEDAKRNFGYRRYWATNEQGLTVEIDKPIFPLIFPQIHTLQARRDMIISDLLDDEK